MAPTDEIDLEALRPALDWTGETVPVARAFDDPYYNTDDGLAETRHVFLGGNDLPARFRPGFQIAELGFGTGLNFLAACEAWSKAKPTGALHYTSFEAHPMELQAASKALAQFDDLWRQRGSLTAMWDILWEGRSVLFGGGIHLHVVIGDARQTVRRWNGAADAWFLDGFSPAKNPEMWEPELMAAVGKKTAAGGTFATYTAAGEVRRSLDDAGFDVERVEGFGTKKHMSRGVLR